MMTKRDHGIIAYPCAGEVIPGDPGWQPNPVEEANWLAVQNEMDNAADEREEINNNLQFLVDNPEKDDDEEDKVLPVYYFQASMSENQRLDNGATFGPAKFNTKDFALGNDADGDTIWNFDAATWTLTINATGVMRFTKSLVLMVFSSTSAYHASYKGYFAKNGIAIKHSGVLASSDMSSVSYEPMLTIHKSMLVNVTGGDQFTIQSANRGNSGEDDFDLMGDNFEGRGCLWTVEAVNPGAVTF